MSFWNRILGKKAIDRTIGVDASSNQIAAAQQSSQMVSPEELQFLPSADLLQWAPEAKAYVQEEQERMYRSLADSLGFNSDPKKAFEALSGRSMPCDYVAPEKLKRELSAQFNFSPQLWQQFDESFPANLKQFLEIEPPTIYEDPNWYRSMMLTLSLLLNSLREQGNPLSPNPLLGTLPSGDMNARVLVVPWSKVPVILFEQGLFHFVNDFTRVIACSMPPIFPSQMSDDNALVQLPRNFAIPEEAAEYFYSSVYAYSVKGTPRAKASSLDCPPDNQFVAMALIQQSELFVMAHEVAHFIKGHLASTPANANEAWKQEYEADAAGLSVITRRAHNLTGNWAVAAWACDVVLGFFHFLGHATATLEYGTDQLRWISKSYPPPLYRQRYLRNNLVSLVPSFSWLGLRAVSVLDDLTQAIFNDLWRLTSVRLLAAHKQGIRPSPLWKDEIQSTHTFQTTVPKDHALLD